MQLRNAARTMSDEPIAIQLRYLQTLTEIAVEKNSTIIFPVPIDLLTIVRSMVDSLPVVAEPATPSAPLIKA